MLILDFTNRKRTSNAKKGYFDQWNELFGIYGYHSSELNEEDLETTLTTNGARSFASYFNSIKKLNRKIKWVFGNSDKYIQVDSLELDVEGTDDSDNDYQSYFMDNIFSLGDGTNYFDFYLDFDDHYRIQDSIRERLRAKGLKFKILGGSGADHIEVDISTDDKVDLSSRSSFVANTKGGRDCIEVDSCFQLSAKIDSGSGSDTVDLCEANSSFVNTSKNNDTVFLGRDDPDSLDELKLVKNIKDIIVGGSGRDQFVFNKYLHGSMYNLNRDKDFCVLKDYQNIDQILYYGNEDLRIDSRDGTIKLAATGAYKAQSVGYTARLYADNDLIAYISGEELSISDILQSY